MSSVSRADLCGRSKLDPVAHSLALDAFGGSLPPGHDLYLEGTPKMVRFIFFAIAVFACIAWALLNSASYADDKLRSDDEPLSGWDWKETEYDAYVGMN